MERHLSGRTVVLRHRFEADDETAITPGVVTVTVTRAGRSDATATGEATREGDAYTFTVGPLAEGAYVVKWDGATVVDVSAVEAAGSVLFSFSELRASDIDFTPQRFDTDTVRRVRAEVESEFEAIVGRSFTRRTLFFPAGRVCPAELLPFRDVRSVTVVGGQSDGTPLPFETVGPFAFAPESVPEDAAGVDIAFGFETVPDGIRRVALIRARWMLAEPSSGIPDRATSFQPVEGGTYQLATPGRAGWETGIPEVDAELDRYRLRLVDSVAIV